MDFLLNTRLVNFYQFQKKQIEFQNEKTEDCVISKDDTISETYTLQQFREAAERLGKVKKSELKIGRLRPKERFNCKED